MEFEPMNTWVYSKFIMGVYSYEYACCMINGFRC